MQNLAIIAGAVSAAIYAGWWIATQMKSAPDAQEDKHATALEYCVWLANYAGGDSTLEAIRTQAIEAKYPITPTRDAK